MSSIEPIRFDAASIDLSRRFRQSATIATSPTGTGATVIASLTIPDRIAVAAGVRLDGFAYLTVGTSGTSVRLQIRRTDATGTLIADSGLVTATATNVVNRAVHGIDTGPTLPGQVYALVAAVAAADATASSPVSGAYIGAVVV